MAKKKVQHGGKREGAGRKPTLEDPQKLLIRFEPKHVAAVDRFARKRKLGTRNEALRTLVEETLLTEESDK